MLQCISNRSSILFMMQFIKAFLVALVCSVAGNLIILFILRPFVIDPAMPLHALSVGLITPFTIAGVIGATIVYALLRYFFPQPNTIFLWISGAVLLASFIPDYQIIGVTEGMFAGGTWPTALTLALMHVVAAVIIVWSLTQLWGSRAQNTEITKTV